MLKELTFQEVEELAKTGEWPMLATAVECRKNDKNYMSGEQKTIFNSVGNNYDDIMGVFGYEFVNSKRSGDCVYVGPLCVHKKYRNRGIGSLMVMLIQISVGKTNTKLLLYAHKDIQGFYEKHGFKAVYEVDKDYQAMEWTPDKECE